MAEPRPKLDLKIVDENYVPAAGASQADVAKGTVAAAIREGRRRANSDMGKTINDIVAGQTARIAAERDARPTTREETKHGWARLWQGIALGSLVGFSAAIVVGSLTLGSAFEQARQYGAGMVAVGAATQAASPPSTCIPGERLRDGRTCPLTTDTSVEP